MINKKAVLVTGGAKGIGYAIAKRFAKDGYAVIVMDIAEEGCVVDSIGELNKIGSNCIYIQGDITSQRSRQETLDKIKKTYGRLDVLVNNAGVAPGKRMDILETTQESLDHVLGINLKGTFFLTQEAANYMIEQVTENGSIDPVIINISSISAGVSSPSRGEYCISKAGVSMITTLFADRLAEYGINLYEIRPGIILTDMTKKVKEKYDRLIDEGLVPFKRWGYPEDVANAAAGLCSGDFAFSTGDIIYVDGGFHIQRL